MKKGEIGMLDNKKQKLAPESTSIRSYEITVEKITDKYLGEQELYYDFVHIDSIIDEYNAEKGFLVSILQDLQKEYGYLAPEALIHVSKRLDLPLIQVYRVAMFYKNFRIVSLKETANGNRSLENNVKKDYLSKFIKKESGQNDR